MFLLLHASSSEALGFLFYFSVLFFLLQGGIGGDNTAYGSRRQGWMVCVGTLIICMSPQNALLLFAPPGCCACFTSSLPQWQEVQGNKASAIQSRRARVPTRVRNVVCIRSSGGTTKTAGWTRQECPKVTIAAAPSRSVFTPE